jgi:ParB family transcriptional regulator, chromosome partitioning protein
MTDTITAEHRHGTDSQDGAAGGTIEHLDPHSLEVGDNVREYANLNKPFLDSIAEHGVLTPITAIRRPDGVVEVRNGQRRTMAARKLGLSSVPVYVLPATAADTAAETIDRIVHQIVTNDHKSDLTDAQRARGIQQMIDAGLSVSKVAKKLAVGKDTVTAAQSAAKSSVALEALDGGQISLAEAAPLTEFEHDGPEAVDRLVRAAGTPQFDHVVSQLRSERASAQALAEASAHYTERGFTILDEQQRRGWDPARVPLRYLQRDGDDGEPESVDESVITNPQHWAVWLDEYTQYLDSDGNVVEEDQIDWDTTDDADAEPDKGLRHADSARERPAFAPEWFCLNPDAAGLQVSEMYHRNADWYARQHRGQSHTAGRRCRQPRQRRQRCRA